MKLNEILVDNSMLYPVCVKAKWGYINRGGEIVVPPRYTHCSKFSDGLGHASGRKEAYLDAAGKIICEVDFEESYDFSEELCVFSEDEAGFGKDGYFNKDGRIQIAAKFDTAFPFSEGLASVELNEKYGVIDIEGNLIVPDKYEYIGRFVNRMAPACIEKKWGFITPQGDWALDLKATLAFPFSEEIALLQIGETWAYIDRQGDWVIPPNASFSNAESFSNGLAAIMDRNTGWWGFCDKFGNSVIPPQFVVAASFSEGLAPVYVGGYLDEDGEPRGGAWGYCDIVGNLHIPPAFDEAEPFVEGIARVGIGGDSFIDRKYGYIDQKGKWIWEVSK